MRGGVCVYVCNYGETSHVCDLACALTGLSVTTWTSVSDDFLLDVINLCRREDY